MSLPTLDYVRSILSYDPETGEFFKMPGRFLIPERGKCRTCYRSIRIDGVAFQAHRVAWLLSYGEWPCTYDMDHKDGDKKNNRLSNLRLATRSQNMANRCRNKNKVYPKGVRPHASGYRARLRHNKKLYNLGTFPTVEEAHSTYLKKAAEMFGEFARNS